MPTYQYRCSACGNEFDRVQKFSDPALTTCESCGGDLRKVYSAVGVVFKGSGFYATDNRTKGASAAANGESSGTSDKSDKSDKGGKSSESSTPAAAKDSKPSSDSGAKPAAASSSSGSAKS